MSLDVLPAELILLIAFYCGPAGRREFKQCSRQAYWGVREHQRKCMLEIYPSRDASFDRRRYVMSHAGSTHDMWLRMSTADELSAIHWTFSATIQTPMAMHIANIPRTFFSALPATLQVLELTVLRSFGPFMMRSLDASLPHASGLQRVVLRGFTTAEIAHVINSLARRARHPFNQWITQFVADVSTGEVLTWPSGVDASGLALLSELRINVRGNLTATECAGLQHVVDAIMASGKSAISHFEYIGPPLAGVDAWTAMVRRSAATLVDLTVPPFYLGAQPTLAEMAIDAATNLRRLVITWQYARLDFVLRNKPQLEVLHHYGGVANPQCLVAQLTQTISMRDFLLAADLGAEFADLVHKFVRWPQCASVALGGLSMEYNEALRSTLVQCAI